MGRLLGRVFVGFVSFLISFISYSAQIFVIWPWYGNVLSVELISLLAPFNLLVGMLWWNYYLCITTDPGQVPTSWQPDTYSGDGYEVKKLTGNPRFCRSCQKYKPPRTHHCKECNRCILRMDHHCPWINNCVGHYNYGHFIRFLFFVDLACSYHLTMITRRVFDTMGEWSWDEPSAMELVFIILNYTLCVPVLLAVGGFSLYHYYSLLGNSTTIEGWEKDKVATLVRRGKIREIKFPYNLGPRRNIASVLGDNPLMWCWPTVPPGTGLKYQLADGDDPAIQARWPPTDPTTQHHEIEGDDHALVLPSSPWTYSNGALNPGLYPTSAGKRRSKTRKAKMVKGPISSLPPFHPDYEPPLEGDENGIIETGGYSSISDESSDDYAEPVIPGAGRIRRGSEGYELPPINREEMLRRYIEGQVGEAGRYNVYVPEPASESSEGDNEEETVPLAVKVESWRMGTANGIGHE